MADERRVKVVYTEMLSKGPEHPPFDALPEWLLARLDQSVRLSHRGARDYAVLDVDTADGVKEATPGDFIVLMADGHLDVEQSRG